LIINIFPAPTFVSEGVKGTMKKEAKEFYIPKQLRENSLYGTEFEIKLRNQLTQRAIARECADWVRAKVKFKSNVTSNGLQNFIYLDNGEKHVAYSPIKGFTSVDLGYEQNDMLYQGITKGDDNDGQYSKFFFNQFANVWNDSSKMEDVTNSVADYIATAYKENSPEFIYFLTLYNIFSEFLDDIMSEDYLPNDLTGYQDSLIWKKLYNFQRDGAVGVINKLEKYNGCILADSVGLGKTFTALAVMKYYSSRNKNILVLTPKRLSDNWNRYRDNTRTNIFWDDHIRFDVLYHTDLGRTSGTSNGHNLATFNWGNYDLLVIDESHNFRNAFTFKDRMTRYDFLMQKVIKEGVKTKVLMLSATPVNNHFSDLRNQLALAYGDDVDEFNAKIGSGKTVNAILNQAQKAFNAWAKLPKEQRSASDLMKSLDIDFSVLLDDVTIARSRKHILKYYDMSEIGPFPERLPPKSFYTDMADAKYNIGYKNIYESLMDLNLGIYAPTNYIHPSKLSKYTGQYDISPEIGGLLSQESREKGIQKLMTINMMKRLESCVESFRLTLRNVEKTCEDTLDTIKEYEKSGNGTATKMVREFSQINPDDIAEDEDFDIGASTTIGKIKIDLADMDVRRWKNDITHDIETLSSLCELMEIITPERDLKLQKLIEVIDDKIDHPINPNNKKVLVFSAFSDTTDYLYKHLAKHVKDKYGMETAEIQGGNSNKTTIPGSKDTDRLLTMFSPIAKEKAKVYPNDPSVIDLLIATDCVSEGQNLQDCDICINYDIHWNPVRIVQRFGRIDRIGSQNKVIQLVNFWPNLSLDEYIGLNAKVESRMVMVDMTATGGENIIAKNEEQVDLDYRAVQLKKLREGQLQDLEDVDGNITITDLGLNEFRMDMISHIKAHGKPENVPNGLYAVVPEDLGKGIKKGVIFVLRNRNENVNIDKKNRLHPYYLVYVSEKGEILTDYMDPKKILDILRSSCKHETDPILPLCNLVNKETDDGYKMDAYSKLLEDAVKSIVHVKEENDLSSLFTTGSGVLTGSSIPGLDDFELITFVVVK
jgi:SNF2 family DNA or RNA helicase